MEHKDRSLIFSRVLVKLCYAVCVACCIFAPALVRYYDEKIVHLTSGESVAAPLLVTLYCCVPFGVCVLVCLDILLKNIGNGTQQ